MVVATDHINIVQQDQLESVQGPKPQCRFSVKSDLSRT